MTRRRGNRTFTDVHGPWAQLVLVGLCSCANAEDAGDRPLARAFDQVLHWSDLRQVVPMEATPQDSAAIAQGYIEAWMRQQAVLHMAEANQRAERLDMEAQLEDYRRSLVIFNYEQALVEQKLDTSVSAAEIERYYEENRANFELKEAVLRARWFKVLDDDPRVLRRMSAKFLSERPEDLREVEIWLAERGFQQVDRSGSWFPTSELRAELPVGEKEAMTMLNGTGRRVFASGRAAVFVDVLDLRQASSVSPLEMERSGIRSILLNRRKLRLIEAMREDVYAQALQNKDVERFDH